MKKGKILLLQAMVSLLPLLYIILQWTHLPAQVPMHYNIDNQVDRYGAKSEMALMLVIMSAVAVGSSAVILFADRLDPKKQLNPGNPLVKKISWGVVIFVTVLSGYIAYITVNFDPNAASLSAIHSKGIELLVVAFFIFLGNIIGNVKPNYFIGVRVPWTLEDADNWKQTHRFAGKLWFWGGLVLLVAVLISPAPYSVVIMLSSILLLTVLPMVYSFIIYRKRKIR